MVKDSSGKYCFTKNIMGNNNGTSAKNENSTSKPIDISGIGPDVRPKQTDGQVAAQVCTAFTVNGMIVILAIIMIIFFHVRLKSSIPYLMLQNVFVLDLFTALTPGFVWSFLLVLDSYGIALPLLCRAVGFLHSFLYHAFLLNIAVISFSQFLLYVEPALYGKIFVNCIVTRIILLTVWAAGGLLSAPPLTSDGLSGVYDKFESTCWIKWAPIGDGSMSYNIMVTLLTLFPALGFTAVAVMFMIRGKNDQEPNNPAPQKDVIIIAAIQLLIFFILWLALTIMNSEWNKHWSNVNYKVDMAFLFLFFARGLWNAIVCFAVSKNVRTAFADVFIPYHCRSGRVAPLDQETKE